MSLLTEIKDAIREYYILVDRIDATIDAFDQRTKDMDVAGDPQRLAHDITTILRDITHDKHFALSYKSPDEKTEDAPRRFAPNFSRQNNFFYTAKRLYGNVGYLEFCLFPDHQEAMETAIGAMAMLAHTDALIFDIRHNRGGSPAMIQLLLSYLFADPTHLITFESRDESENWQTWTLPYVPGRRYLNKPVYVLTSSFTGSAAEEFAYDLQQLERATLVGQTTIGAGHIVRDVELSDGFMVYISSARPVNAVSKAGWEGVGVVPHIETALGDELSTAHLHALNALYETTNSDEYKRFLKWETDITTTQYTPYIPEDVSDYIGWYENAEIVQDGNRLNYLSNGATLPMTPIDKDVFIIRDGDMRLTFSEETLLTEWRDNPNQLVRRKL